MTKPYFEKYLRRVNPLADPIEQLSTQGQSFADWLRSVNSVETDVLHPPYTWTFREVLKHICDCERVFAFRALWLARGSQDALPSFDEHLFLTKSSAKETPWVDLIDEFASVRSASLTLFKNLPDESWYNRGLAAGFEMDVTMLHGMIYGHLDHHLDIMNKRLSR